MPDATVRSLDWSYLLIRTIKVSHRCEPSIVDRIGEDRPRLLLVGLSDVALRKSYRALCQDVWPPETASLMFPRADW